MPSQFSSPFPPGLAGYMATKESNERSSANNLNSAIGSMGMLAQLQKQQQEQQLLGILSSDLPMEQKQAALMKVPGGIGILEKLSQMQKVQGDVSEQQRQQQFFSPSNRSQFVVPGTPGQPAEELPVGVSGPTRPAIQATPDQFDMRRFAQTGAVQGIKGTETLLNHLGQREQAQATMEQTAVLRREQMQQQADLARERSEDMRLTERERNQARMDLVRLAASLRQPPPAPSVTVSRIQDPNDPTRMLEVDARTYRGGSLGSPGVIGLSGREGDAQKRENKRQFAMQGIGGAIAEAEALLTDKAKPPTGSGVGSAVDYAGSLVGYSPGGAVEAQKLKAVGGALVSKVPRMEGPQSDKDLNLYKEMAGMVGDASIPIDRRIAALDTVKLLWEKYERLNPGTFADRRTGDSDEPPPGAVRRKR